MTKEKGYIPEITVQMKGLHYLQRVPLCIQILDTKIMQSQSFKKNIDFSTTPIKKLIKYIKMLESSKICTRK